MTVAIQVAGASFSKFITKAPPLASDCQLLAMFGKDAASSLKNYLGAKAPLVEIGEPAYGAGFASVGGSVGFDSGIVSPSNSWTHCVVATVGAGNGLYIGNWKAGDPDAAIGRFNTKILPYISGSTRGAGVDYASANGFNFMAASHDGVTANVHAGNNGALNSASTAFASAVITAPLQIGAHFGSGTTANNTAMSMSFSRALTAAEVGQVYAYMKYMCGQRGIAVA